MYAASLVALLAASLTGVLQGCAAPPARATTQAARDTIAPRAPGSSPTPTPAAVVTAPRIAPGADVEPPSASSASSPASPSTSSSIPRLAIVTGNVRETDYRIGVDLARLVAAPAGIRLDVRASKGSSDNLHQLIEDPSVDLALVQYDVLQAVADQAARGNAAAERIVRPLRVLAPLYTQEFHLVVRADSPMTTVDQIAGATIGAGPVGSGSALSTAALYRRLFDAPVPRDRLRYLDDDRLLVALTVERSIDVAVIVAGQPAQLFDGMKPEARRFIRLLRFDASRPSSAAALAVYFPATIRAASYPSWLDVDVPTVSVLSFLVAKEVGEPRTLRAVGTFARSLCARLGALRAEGHPKWREVDVRQRLGRGWRYAPAFADDLSRCAPDGAAARVAGVRDASGERGVAAVTPSTSGVDGAPK